ncbi:uncharacterized protein BDR25DRAFT_314152 [Lindgomyces ingoldianus]|uniref:Uncharacterized protein n=1 Tax=Lindgomyces ingoldianus TaxID=673940 RepID=A0ACB6QVD6_9PLEO|nr:uncharacterized protein BDR25DRAFT_314152 [Lindgomyces ingoldianus]KAF2470979.1 hypothetical protein BDR25DRAFT_314152 [Lindgomyces ingoldianus]
MSSVVPMNLLIRETTATSLPTTTHQPCTWLGHCLGATCSTNNDCDNDWICVNKKCSPCCEGSTETVSSTGTATTAATTQPHHGLSTTTAIAIGVAIVVFLAVGVGFGFWVLRLRRPRHNPTWETPANNSARFESSIPSTYPEDQKRLVGNESPAELAVLSRPMELSSIELVELEGDPGREGQQISIMDKHPLTIPPQVQAGPRQRSPHYRFEEYQVSPEVHTPGQLRFSPVSNPSPHPSHGDDSNRMYQENTTLRGGIPFMGPEESDNAYTLFRWPRTTGSPLPESAR